jgi:hypothetical protein
MLDLDGEADKVGFWLRDVEPDQVHSLTAPDLAGEALLGGRVLKLGHRWTPLSITRDWCGYVEFCAGRDSKRTRNAIPAFQCSPAGQRAHRQGVMTQIE